MAAGDAAIFFAPSGVYQALAGAISGPSSLSGARVTATDIRAGAAFLVAALAAQEHTVIDSVQHFPQGDEDLPRRLRSVGADISDYLDGRYGDAQLL